MKQAIDTLKRRFGRSHLGIESLINKTRELAKVDEDDLNTVISSSCSVENLVVTMENLNSVGHMHNPPLLQELTQKLPTSMQFEWAKKFRYMSDPTLRDFANWLSAEADADSQVNFKVMVDRKNKKVESRRQVEMKTDNRDDEMAICSYCRNAGHKIWQRDKFKSDDVDTRWKFVTERHLCFICLTRGHRVIDCKRHLLEVQGCSGRHHALLHKDDKIKDPQRVRRTNIDETEVI